MHQISNVFTYNRVTNSQRNVCTFFLFFFFFLQGRFYLKNRQKPTATIIYTDNIIYNIYTTYIPPPPIINIHYIHPATTNYKFPK